MHALMELGCRLAQGFLLGRPQPIADLPRDLAPPPTVETRGTIRLTQPVAAELIAEAQEVDPRSTAVSFAEKRRRLEELDGLATESGAAARSARVEIGRRLTLASVYAGEYELVVKWALQTSRMAESIDEWGSSAEVLAILASCPDDPSTGGGVRIEALVRAMELRISKRMGADQSSGVDNAIGSAFANLGLFEHARRWWSESAERYRTATNPGAAMLCLNMADLYLQHLEGTMPVPGDGPAELTVAKVEQMLEAVETNVHSPPAAAAALRCRLELVRGDVAAAVSAMESIEPGAIDILSQFLTLAAKATLARVQGDTAEFLGNTTALVGALDGHLLLAHHDRNAQRLHGQALLTAGRVDEGVAVLQQAFVRQYTADAEKLLTLFEWIRLHVDVNVRFAELFDRVAVS